MQRLSAFEGSTFVVAVRKISTFVDEIYADYSRYNGAYSEFIEYMKR